MINLKRILVPTDFSESARHALLYGTSFAREYEGELLLLHVVENLTVGYASDLFPVPMAEVFDEISGYAKAELAKLGAEVRQKGIAVRELVVQGKPLRGDRAGGPRGDGGHDRARHPRQGNARQGALRIHRRAGDPPCALPRAHGRARRARVRARRRAAPTARASSSPLPTSAAGPSPP